MLHIKPIREEEASDSVKLLYADIQKLLGIEFVPLLFQLLANFEVYFQYLWERMRQNVQSKELLEGASDVVAYAHRATIEVYHPSIAMKIFMEEIKSPRDIEHIKNTIITLEYINSKLMLLTLGLRESLKGVLVGVPLLTARTGQSVNETLFSEILTHSERIGQTGLVKTTHEEATSRMLAPLAGNQTIVLSYYAEFFAHIAREVEELVKTQEYLQKRVELEGLGLILISKFVHPMGSSFTEIASFAANKPYFDELLYLLSEAFPTTFPRLVFTSAVMRKVVESESRNSSLVRV